MEKKVFKIKGNLVDIFDLLRSRFSLVLEIKKQTKKKTAGRSGREKQLGLWSYSGLVFLFLSFQTRKKTKKTKNSRQQMASEQTRKLSPGVSALTQTRSSQNAAFMSGVIDFLPPATRLPSPATPAFSPAPPEVRRRRLAGLKCSRRHHFLATKPLIKTCGCCFARVQVRACVSFSILIYLPHTPINWQKINWQPFGL